jgi:hypothetical protein
MNDPWNIAKKSQEDVDPKMLAQADLQKNAKRRQKNSTNNANKIHMKPSQEH